MQEAVLIENQDDIYPGSTFNAEMRDMSREPLPPLDQYYSDMASHVRNEASPRAFQTGALQLANLIEDGSKEPPIPMIIDGQRIGMDDGIVRQATGRTLWEASNVLLDAPEHDGQEVFLAAIHAVTKPQAFAVKHEVLRIFQAHYVDNNGDYLTGINGARLRFTQYSPDHPERFDISMSVDSAAIEALNDPTLAEQPFVPEYLQFGPGHTALFDAIGAHETITMSLSDTALQGAHDSAFAHSQHEVTPITHSAEVLAELESLLPYPNETWGDGVQNATDLRRLLRARIAEANHTRIPTLEGDDGFAVAERLRLTMKEVVAFVAPPIGAAELQNVVVYDEPVTYGTDVNGNIEMDDPVGITVAQELQRLLGADLKEQAEPDIYHDKGNRFTSKVVDTQVGDISLCVRRFQRIDDTDDQPLPEQLQILLRRPNKRPLF